MNCLECFKHNFKETAAAAVCHHCGAGLCTEHLMETEITITKTVVMAREVPLPLKARRIFCRLCSAALEQPR